MYILILFLVITLASALVVLFSKNVLHSAFALLLTFLGIAALYVFAQADFVAVAQIMIYVGGILVLMLFGIMLTNTPTGNQTKALNVVMSKSQNSFWGITIAISTFSLLFMTFKKGMFSLVNELNFKPIVRNTTLTDLGIGLMTDYVFAFELTGILLMMVLLGAAYLSSK